MPDTPSPTAIPPGDDGLAGRADAWPDTPADAAEITQWLAGLPGAVSAQASQALFELLYQELRRLARAQLRREGRADRGEHTFSATALTHELWFRMSEQVRTPWRNRSHFMAVAATMMRRILVNHELARRAAKRDAPRLYLTQDSFEALPAPADADVVAVHQALQAFEAIDARAARVVELRYFGGLELPEIAELLGTSPATVKRDLTVAGAWLRRALAA